LRVEDDDTVAFTDLETLSAIALRRPFPPGVIDEDTPHRRGGTEEMAGRGEGALAQPQPRFMHLLAAIEQGDQPAADQLLPLVCDELRKLAAAQLAQERPGHTLEATALVENVTHEASPAGTLAEYTTGILRAAGVTTFHSLSSKEAEPTRVPL